MIVHVSSSNNYQQEESSRTPSRFSPQIVQMILVLHRAPPVSPHTGILRTRLTTATNSFIISIASVALPSNILLNTISQ